jgi:hypothetical protein
VNVRIKISALWASMLFVFAYVDLFSLYRPDFRADIEAGQVAGFAVNQAFLLGTTGYVVIPSLMVFCVLVMRPRLNRILNIALAVLYAVSIVAATIGEWSYYVLGSIIESVLLAASSSTHGPGRRISSSPAESAYKPRPVVRRVSSSTTADGSGSRSMSDLILAAAVAYDVSSRTRRVALRIDSTET